MPQTREDPALRIARMLRSIYSERETEVALLEVMGLSQDVVTVIMQQVHANEN